MGKKKKPSVFESRSILGEILDKQMQNTDLRRYDVAENTLSEFFAKDGCAIENWKEKDIGKLKTVFVKLLCDKSTHFNEYFEKGEHVDAIFEEMGNKQKSAVKTKKSSKTKKKRKSSESFGEQMLATFNRENDKSGNACPAIDEMFKEVDPKLRGSVTLEDLNTIVNGIKDKVKAYELKYLMSTVVQCQEYAQDNKNKKDVGQRGFTQLIGVVFDKDAGEFVKGASPKLSSGTG